MHTGGVGDADGADGLVVGNGVGGLVVGGPWVGGETGGPLKAGEVVVGDNDGGVGVLCRRARSELVPPIQQQNNSKTLPLIPSRGDIGDLEIIYNVP